MTDHIGGLWVAVATPLDTAGRVSHAVLARHAKALMAEGCDGIVPFGTTGEGTSFSAVERLAATEALLAAGIPAAKIAIGTGFPAVSDTIALTKAALALGLHHVLILPPYFYRDVSEAGITDAFAAVFDGVADDRLRTTLYHIPQVSGVAVPATTVATLRARYGKIVAGVKDSSGDFTHFQKFRATAPDVPILVGNEADIGRAVAAGGVGSICGLANLVPSLVRAMFTDPGAEIAMRAAIAQISDPFVPTLKAAMASFTGEPDWARVRAPLRPVEASKGDAIAAVIRSLTVRQAA